MSGLAVKGAFLRAIDATGTLGREKPPEPSTPPPAPTETDTDVQQARANVTRRRRALLKLNPTGGTGDLSTAPVAQKTLLGQ